MSTDDQTPVPRTRAEARAAREAAAETAPPSGATPSSREIPSEGGAAPEASAPDVSAPEVSERAPARVPAPAPDSAPASAPEPAPAPEAPRPARAPRQKRSPADRRFLVTLLAVVGILAIASVGLGVASMLQGPRVSEVQVDPAEAIDVSGSRVILTANQSLQSIDPEQVTVEPAVPFTVDAAGRGVGIRFTVPLDDATEYTVRVADVTGVGGGPASDLTTSFTTPAAEIFLLNRSDEDDQIFRADLSGDGVPVFTHPRINDYRATSTQLVVAVEDDDGSRILVMDRDGEGLYELILPGDGYVSTIQVSDRGGLIGYTYSDREITEDSGRASVLVTQSLSEDAEPQIIEVADEEASIAEWQFVPDSSAVLFIDFAGTLSLDDRAGDAGAQTLGIAMRLLGISRGTYTAIVERVDGTIVELNLADGSEVPLEASDPDFGPATSITPFPGGTLRHVVARDGAGLPTGQAIIRVDDDGVATSLIDVAGGSAILQACASPSGQYAAIAIAPDLAENPYDDMLVPLPQNLQTHLLDLRTGEEMPVLTGFDASWCRQAPAF